MVTDVDLFESPELTPLHFGLWGWMKSIFSKEMWK